MILNNKKEIFRVRIITHFLQKFFFAEGKRCCTCTTVNLSGKNDQGLNNVTIFDIMLKDGDLQNLLNLILMCALLQIYTTEKVILNIFHWNLLVWQQMHKREILRQKGDLPCKICIKSLALQWFCLLFPPGHGHRSFYRF